MILCLGRRRFGDAGDAGDGVRSRLDAISDLEKTDSSSWNGS